MFNSKKEIMNSHRGVSGVIHSSMLRLKKDLRVEQEIDGKEIESQTRQEESKNFILLVLIVFELGSICHDTFVQFLFRSVEGVSM